MEYQACDVIDTVSRGRPKRFRGFTSVKNIMWREGRCDTADSLVGESSQGDTESCTRTLELHFFMDDMTSLESHKTAVQQDGATRHMVQNIPGTAEAETTGGGVSNL